MLLYRYFASHARETIETNLLKVSKPSDFNDPFEFMMEVQCVMTPEKAQATFEERLQSSEFIQAIAHDRGCSFEQALQHFRSTRNSFISTLLTHTALETEEETRALLPSLIDEMARVVCFSTATDEKSDILMWSHYTNNHKGVRIGFELPKRAGHWSRFKVKYQAERIKIDPSETNKPEFEEAVRQSTETKCEAWKYEEEHRLFINPRHTKKKAGLEFIPFDSKWVRRIDLGIRYAHGSDREALIKTVRSKCPHAKLYQAFIAHRGYLIEYREIK